MGRLQAFSKLRVLHTVICHKIEIVCVTLILQYCASSTSSRQCHFSMWKLNMKTINLPPLRWHKTVLDCFHGRWIMPLEQVKNYVRFSFTILVGNNTRCDYGKGLGGNVEYVYNSFRYSKRDMQPDDEYEILGMHVSQNSTISSINGY